MGKRFEGKVALVTGSSSGIGQATAVLFAEEGAKVVITGRNETTLEETRQLILKAGAVESDILAVLGDLIEEEFQQKLVQETVDKFGKLDILINNAGSPGPRQDVGQVTMENYDYVMNLNTRSCLALTQIAMPHLMTSQGDVVIVSSIASLNIAAPGSVAYAMSKAALDQMVRALAIKHAPDGVRINAVNPGLVKTNFISRYGVDNEIANKVYDGMGVDQSLVPRGVCGSPLDIAKAIAFLADRDASSYILGICLVIDGGTSLLNPMMVVDFKRYMS